MEDQSKAIVPLSTNRAIELMKIGNEFRIDSRIVAKGIGIEHKAFIRTLRKYQDRLEKFSQLCFENTVGYRPQGGGNPETYVMLNKNQVSFAITLSRNTEQVVSFKFDLIEAFDMMEQILSPSQPAPLQLPAPLWEDDRAAYLAEPLCPYPTREQVEEALVKTVQLLQPYRSKGVDWRDFRQYSAEIQAYQRMHEMRTLLEIADSLVERTILIRAEDKSGGISYTIASIAGQLQAPQQGEE